MNCEVVKHNSHLNRYKLKEIQRHGEAGSVDIAGVKANSDDDKSEVVPPSIKHMIETCQRPEWDCLFVCTEGVLNFVEAGC